ncbi:MAG: hypothetical protein OMM_02597 [Candidatus Magnetoglobus multicellularis str. Araruama]|uniref:IPTL-CTERM protein sorting domain-containing protein n=1 Tax=Candidatus Magnetoglobus multicellularis str. Araruama TaxID=890399 RepID=A0A1V1P8Q8_9BACT|nr:MAG: hypothetical protein OMM_02597 [Candidatus Magnetoglobus multicellularis str. Araruama]
MKRLNIIEMLHAFILQSLAAFSRSATLLTITILLLFVQVSGVYAATVNSGTLNTKVSCTHLNTYNLDIDSDNVPDLNILFDNAANTLRAHAIGFDLAVDDEYSNFGVKAKTFANGSTLNTSETLREQAILFSQSTGIAIKNTLDNESLIDNIGCIGLYTSEDYPALVRLSFKDIDNDDVIDSMYLASWAYDNSADSFTFSGCNSPLQISLTVCATGCEFTNISAAVAASDNGTTILVKEGTYNEGSLNIAKDIIVKASGSESVSIFFDNLTNGASSQIVLNDQSTLNISQSLKNDGCIQGNGGELVFSKNNDTVTGRVHSRSSLTGFDEIKFVGTSGSRWFAVGSLTIENSLTIDGVHLYATYLNRTGDLSLLNNGLIIGATAVPSLNEWGILFLLFLLSIFSIIQIRRKTYKVSV